MTPKEPAVLLQGEITMTTIKDELARLIEVEVLRLTRSAAVAASAAWAAHETAGDALASYAFAPRADIASAVIETAIRTDRAVQTWLAAQERVNVALAAHQSAW
jgi:hypothetical protein